MPIANEKQLKKAIYAIVRDAMMDRKPIKHSMITAMILDGHSGISKAGDDQYFFLLCANRYLSTVSKYCLKRYRDKEDVDIPQMALAGFERAQAGYSIDRDGEPTLVPLDLCTDAELLERARLIEAQARGGSSHAWELRKIVDLRKKSRRPGQPSDIREIQEEDAA